MIIKLIKFSDFRQFYGEHEIDFGIGNKNTTLIIGANGNGKTGIFRALMFVLYGDTLLDQDNDAADINIINLDKLDENKNSPVKSKVELIFEYNNENYLIKREIVGIKSGNKTKTKKTEPELYIIETQGELSPYTKEPVQLFINRILDPKIREFFFFDAERMQLLDTTKSKKSLSEEIQEGITRLLQIKYLQEAINELDKLKRNKQREINKQVNSKDIDDKSREKEELQDKVKEYEGALEILRREKRDIDTEISAIQIELSKNNEIKELQDKITDKRIILNKNKENRGLHKEKISEKLKEGIQLLGKDILLKNEQNFRDYLDKSSDNIPLALLEQSVDQDSCALCKADVKKGSVQYFSIKKLIDNYKSSELTPIINDILTTSSNLGPRVIPYKRDVEKLLKELAANQNDIYETQLAIETLEEQIKEYASNVDNLTILEKQLKDFEKDSKDYSEKISINESQIQLRNDKIESIDKEIEELTSKFVKVKKDNALKQYLDDFKTILEDTMKEYSYTITLELSDEIYDTFMNLLDKKDSINYKEVTINDKFEIKLMNRIDQNVIQDLSMGQSQIFTLAFILSLAKLASKGRNEINFPLFMDTPFARLSRENRNNLIKNIPSLTNQWILLLSDTEFTSNEKELFEKYNQVGKLYLLNNYEGRTTIEAYNKLSELDLEGY